MQPPRIRFAPVQLKARHDGWTAARQLRFIEELATTKSIARACRAVGMSRESAYKLRERPGAGSFRLAWSAALRPDFDRPRRVSPRAAVRLRRFQQAKTAGGPRPEGEVDELKEMNGPPDSHSAVKPTSSALETLQTYLAALRAQEEQPGRR